MIRLLVDDAELELGEDSSFVLVRANPFIERAGDYTYNIDIDLRNKNNARLYSGMKRINGSFPQPGRTLSLYDGPILLVSGTEVLLSIDDFVAKIQLVGNLSAMNYHFNDNQRIRFLDLGKVESATPTDAARKCSQVFPDADETYPMIRKSDSGTEQLVTEPGGFYNQTADAQALIFNDDSDLMPQPYLLAVLKRIIKALGYSIAQNDIDVNKYGRLIIVQNFSRDEYAKMLPDWTVGEFFDEMEKFFNVVFDFDSSSHLCSIVSVGKFYSERAGVVNLENNLVLDSYSVELNSDPSDFQSQYLNVGYNLDNGPYWKTQRIDPDIKRTSSVVTRNWPMNFNSDDINERNIYYDSTRDLYYVAHEGSINPYGIIVDDFADHVDNELVSQNTLRIRPAKIIYQTIGQVGVFAAPALSISEEETKNFFQILSEGEYERKSEYMDVAFYIGHNPSFALDGHRPVFEGTKTSNRCQCNTTYWMQMFNYPVHFDTTDVEGYDQTYTLRLEGKYGRCRIDLKNSISVDTTRVFHFKFVCKRFLDPRSVFVISNRKFYCKHLQYSSLLNQMNNVVEGDFFPLLPVDDTDDDVPGESEIKTWSIFIKTADGTKKTIDVEIGGTGYIYSCNDWTEIKIDDSINYISIKATKYLARKIIGWKRISSAGVRLITTSNASQWNLELSDENRVLKLGKSLNRDCQFQPVLE